MDKVLTAKHTIEELRPWLNEIDGSKGGYPLNKYRFYVLLRSGYDLSLNQALTSKLNPTDAELSDSILKL